MTPRQIQPWQESLNDYYHYIMDYLHAKYDNHSIDPVYMNEYKQAELSQYEAQARHIVAEYERQREMMAHTPIGHVDK